MKFNGHATKQRKKKYIAQFVEPFQGSVIWFFYLTTGSPRRIAKLIIPRGKPVAIHVKPLRGFKIQNTILKGLNVNSPVRSAG